MDELEKSLNDQESELAKVYAWGNGPALGYHIVEGLKTFSKNPYNFDIQDFLVKENATMEQLEAATKKSSLISQAVNICRRKLISNFHRISLTDKNVNVSYALAIAPLIDPEYKGWLLEYSNKAKESRSSALKDWITYMKEKDLEEMAE